jgi:hypothetical protein
MGMTDELDVVPVRFCPLVADVWITFESDVAPSRMKLKLIVVGAVPFQTTGPEPDAVGDGTTPQSACFDTLTVLGGTQNVTDGNGPSIPAAALATLVFVMPYSVPGSVHEVSEARALAIPVFVPLAPGRMTSLQG